MRLGAIFTKRAAENNYVQSNKSSREVTQWLMFYKRKVNNMFKVTFNMLKVTVHCLVV